LAVNCKDVPFGISALCLSQKFPNFGAGLEVPFINLHPCLGRITGFQHFITENVHLGKTHIHVIKKLRGWGLLKGSEAHKFAPRG
jgi:L-ribulose-5-phosphate 3-epimerase UlaE